MLANPFSFTPKVSTLGFAILGPTPRLQGLEELRESLIPVDQPHPQQALTSLHLEAGRGLAGHSLFGSSSSWSLCPETSSDWCRVGVHSAENPNRQAFGSLGRNNNCQYSNKTGYVERCLQTKCVLNDIGSNSLNCLSGQTKPSTWSTSIALGGVGGDNGVVRIGRSKSGPFDR